MILGGVMGKFPSWFTPRPYQLMAIDSWIRNNRIGLFEMATGTGKTTTSFLAINDVFNLNEKLLVIIICPFTHLVDQWHMNLTQFGFNSTKCHSGAKGWKVDLNKFFADYTKVNQIKRIFVMTNSSFLKNDVQELLRKIDRKMIIIDEAHYAGSIEFSNYLSNDYMYRLGLSATPVRYFDEEGTQKLLSFFGGITYTYSLKEAILNGYLTEYRYYPIKVYLTNKEYSEYEKITKFCNSIAKEKNKKDIYQKMLIKRSKLIQNAENKLLEFEKAITKYENSKHLLIYCGSSIDANERQIDKVCDLLGNKMKMTIGRYTFQDSKSSKETLVEFYKSGDVFQAIVAIKCLDEGMDIPPIRTAFILASTSNPKEYIQRRGRLLRKSPGKNYSEIFDFFVVPPKLRTLFDGDKITYGLIASELRRIEEYFSEAVNNDDYPNLAEEIYSEFHIAKEQHDTE